MTYQLIRGNAMSLPLADESVDLVVTSPPYFAQRSYTDGGEHYEGQIGSEATPQAFLEALWAVTTECVRVLKPSGSLFVNLGDKYAGSGGHNNSGLPGATSGLHAKAKAAATVQGEARESNRATRRNAPDSYNKNVDFGIPAKSLMLLPQRYAIGCIDQLGLICRAEVIWSKPNGLPESVTDRVRRSHEQWFHFTKEPRYFSAVDEVREASTGRSQAGGPWLAKIEGSVLGRETNPHGGLGDYEPNPLGKLPGSVWTDGDGTDPGLSTIGAVLNAVKDGYLTPEEGEAILWVGRNDSGQRSTSRGTAGGGQASSTDTDTAGTGTLNKATDERTDSPTNSPKAPSPTDSPSTISAGTDGASTPTTSSPSASKKTSTVDPSPTSAPTDTHTTSATPTSGPTASENAGHAWPTVCVNEGDSASPPSVWVVPTEPLRVPDHLGVDHFAAFPSEWPRRIILGWSPSGVCVACGEGRRPVVDTQQEQIGVKSGGRTSADDRNPFGHGGGWDGKGYPVTRSRTTITGYACACPDTTAPTRPAVVLDPFAGTGTVPAVAHILGRHGIGIDLSADYLRLAEWRCNDPALRAKVLRVDKPKAVPDGQLDIFGGEAA